MSSNGNSSSALAPRASAVATSGTVVVKVGAEAKAYTLHKELLTFHSGFFRGALSGHFEESIEGVINLKDLEVDAFNVFVDWMYEKALPEYIPSGLLAPWPLRPRIIGFAFHVYIMADMLLAFGLKKALFDALFPVLAEGTGCAILLIRTFWDHLPHSDPLHQLVLDSFCVHREFSGMSFLCRNILTKLHKDVLACIILRLGELEEMNEEERKIKRENYEWGETDWSSGIRDSEVQQG
ncbi:hypothetical protein J1614_004134 [Plenodomus biglobosus]|nr:hypothetical protein J1614_004134 [Plenodomus biglobosus]